MGHVLRLSNDWQPGVISLPRGHLAISRLSQLGEWMLNGIPWVEGRDVLSVL